MAQLENLIFEVERRVSLFKPTTTMTDGSLLGYNGDPNSVSSGGTAGEYLIYAAPLGTSYQQSNGTMWFKKALPNSWTNYANSTGSTNTNGLPLSGGTIGGNLTVTGDTITNNLTVNGNIIMGSGSSISNLYTYYTKTLMFDGWTLHNGFYEQTISVSGVTANNDITISLTTDRNSFTEYGRCRIMCIEQNTNTLTFNSEKIPNINITINIKIL